MVIFVDLVESREGLGGILLERNRKIDNMEIKIITFVIEPGVKSTVTLYNEGQV